MPTESTESREAPQRPSFIRENWKQILASGGPFLLLLFYILCLNHVSLNEVGIEYNAFNGKIVVQKQPGWYVTSPFSLVAEPNTLPQKVEIVSDAKIINAKWVRFDPDGIEEYIRVQGWSWMMDSKLNNILLGYAFSGKEYSFLKLVEDPSVIPTEKSLSSDKAENLPAK